MFHSKMTAISGAGVLALVLLAPPTVGFASGRQLQDEGTFRITLGGKPAGTEKFLIQTSKDAVEVKARIGLSAPRDGKTLEFHTASDLILNSDLQPETYTWKLASEQSSGLRIDFRTSPATAEYRTVDGKKDVRQFALPKDVVVLDDNVLTHYEILVERYERSSKGKQVFPAFIPQEAVPGRITMEKAGDESIEIGARKIKARHYTVTTELAKIDLWTDKEGHLWQIAMPAAQLKADRQ
jgi:Domain of unknown function (DUF6134)